MNITHRHLKTLSAVVRAIDERYPGEIPPILQPSVRLARTIVDADNAGVAVSNDQLDEAAAALAGALRRLEVWQ